MNATGVLQHLNPFYSSACSWRGNGTFSITLYHWPAGVLPIKLMILPCRTMHSLLIFPHAVCQLVVYAYTIRTIHCWESFLSSPHHQCSSLFLIHWYISHMHNRRCWLATLLLLGLLTEFFYGHDVMYVSSFFPSSLLLRTWSCLQQFYETSAFHVWRRTCE